MNGAIWTGEDFYDHFYEGDHLDEFASMVNRTSLPITFPNPTKAPWHVQAVVDGVEYNFWPHTMKWQEKYQKSVTVKSWATFDPAVMWTADKELELFE